jgi:hypothetical protein
MKNRFHTPRSFWLVALLAAVASGACGETKTSFSDVSASGGANGGASGWTYVPPGTNPTGSGGTLGNAGSSSGGSPGHAGSAGSAGAGGSAVFPPVTFKCGGKQPNQPLITKFDAFMADRWMSPGNLDGGVYVYPDPLKPTAGDFLRFADQVDDYTGMGVWFSGCIDGSKFRGVRFTIAGNAGASGTVQFYVISNRDKDVNETDSVGSCVPADPNDTWQSCRPPVVTLPVNGQPTTHSIPWSAFKAGLPSPTTDGSDLIALQWSFDWLEGAKPYAAELTVDNLEFFTDDSAVGSGGAGGASSALGNAGGAAETP